MKIVDAFVSGEPIAQLPARAITPDCLKGKTAQVSVQTEHVVSVLVNGIPTMTVTCSPDHLPELVLGRLFSEGLIRTTAEVDSILIDEEGVTASVTLTNRAADLSRTQVEKVVTVTGAQTLNAYYTVSTDLPVLQPIEWDPKWVFELSKLMATDTPMHKVTFGVHSCFLAHEGEVLYCCEDLGRHNAFDKIIGCALRDGIDLTQCVAYSSGRLPVDMVTKAIRAGIPVLASKAVPTETTVKIARAHNLALICSAHPDKMVVLNDFS